ncbi:MAG: hypothetical protein DRJ42_14765 [Deltaproteobacteria bacterium]|nr:MAG: hypothetical protein DRJ42_14765 [Deltaproteobacteria bacterium]
MKKQQARVLVVDDSRSTRAALSRFLEKAGHRVVVVASGEEALDILGRESFDLVLLDVVMKGIDGLDVLTKIREQHTKLELPVLMATARADSSDIIRALELGANDYITKPIDLPIAGARVEGQLALRGEMASVRAKRPLIGVDGSLALGTVLDGRYELLEIIGAGGFAVVYRARQVSTGQDVAVKLMKAHRAVSGDVELARFRLEMSIIADLRHPHIVSLVDSGWLEVESDTVSVGSKAGAKNAPPATSATISIRPEIERPPTPPGSVVPPLSSRPPLAGPARLPFIVMEYLSGESLYAHLERETQLTVERTVDLLLPIMSALHEAHSRGAIHRDLKPGNIFLARSHDGSTRPLVLDFGIAKLVGGEAHEELTQDPSEGIIGTPGWWAPEQAQGKTELDRRTDEFQLGAVIYRCITGKKAFTAHGPKLLYQVADGQFEAPRHHVPDLDEGFEAVLLQMMATDPADRYPTMRSVARELLPYASKRAYHVWQPVFAPGDTLPPEN